MEILKHGVGEMKSFALLVDVADTVIGVLNGEWPCDFD